MKKPFSTIRAFIAEPRSIDDCNNIPAPGFETNGGTTSFATKIVRWESHFAFVPASCAPSSAAFWFRLNAKPINPSNTKTAPAIINQCGYCIAESMSFIFTLALKFLARSVELRRNSEGRLSETMAYHELMSGTASLSFLQLEIAPQLDVVLLDLVARFTTLERRQ